MSRFGKATPLVLRPLGGQDPEESAEIGSPVDPGEPDLQNTQEFNRGAAPADAPADPASKPSAGEPPADAPADLASKPSAGEPPKVGGLGALLGRAGEARALREAQNESVETVTCVFSVETKRKVKDAADAAEKSVAKWISEAFLWCVDNGISAKEIADVAALVAQERNQKLDSGASCRAAGTGVPVRGLIYFKVAAFRKSVRPRISSAAVLEAAAVIRLHAVEPAEEKNEGEGQGA